MLDTSSSVSSWGEFQLCHQNEACTRTVWQISKPSFARPRLHVFSQPFYTTCHWVEHESCFSRHRWSLIGWAGGHRARAVHSLDGAQCSRLIIVIEKISRLASQRCWNTLHRHFNLVLRTTECTTYEIERCGDKDWRVHNLSGIRFEGWWHSQRGISVKPAVRLSSLLKKHVVSNSTQFLQQSCSTRLRSN